MRCMACGAEMIVMQVVEDNTMPVPGFEHHTFMCSACYDVERRLVFNKPNAQGPLPVHAAPPIAPASAANGRAVPRLLTRVLAKLRGRQHASS
jgi:hypothetical protein